jgi:hypothetical protein
MKKPFCSSEKQALANNAEGQRRKSRQVTTYPADILGSLVLETCKKEDYDALMIWQLDNVVEYLPPELTGRHRYVSRMKAHVTGRSSWSSNVGTVRKRSMQHKFANTPSKRCSILTSLTPNHSVQLFLHSFLGVRVHGSGHDHDVDGAGRLLLKNLSACFPCPHSSPRKA